MKPTKLPHDEAGESKGRARTLLGTVLHSETNPTRGHIEYVAEFGARDAPAFQIVQVDATGKPHWVNLSPPKVRALLRAVEAFEKMYAAEIEKSDRENRPRPPGVPRGRTAP